MAIKTEVKQKRKDDKPIEYPWIGVGFGGVIVLFEAKDAGTVIKQNSSFDLGYYSNAWDENYFNIFTGEITLSNED